MDEEDVRAIVRDEIRKLFAEAVDGLTDLIPASSVAGVDWFPMSSFEHLFAGLFNAFGGSDD